MANIVEAEVKAVVRSINAAEVPNEVKKLAKNTLQLMINHPAFANPEYKWSLNDFEFGSKLGRGKFGRVFLAREKRTGYVVALKTISKRQIVKNSCQVQILREIEIQSHLRHPHILQLLCWFHDDFRIYVCLEYAGEGELYSHLNASPNQRFDEHLSAKYTYQVADALHYCHENQVIHRDLKPENLLLTHDGNIKLADFGWSVHAPSFNRGTMCGTLDYLPPEMVVHSKYGKYVDHWCLGVLCYEFLVGRAPFTGKDKSDTYENIKAVRLVFPSHVTSGARDLITKLLVPAGDKRLELPLVMKHPWIQANK